MRTRLPLILIPLSVALACGTGAATTPATAPNMADNPYRALQALDAQLLRVGHRLATNNVGFCNEVQGSVGIGMHVARQYPEEGRAVFGFRHPVQVLTVIPQTPAFTGGVRVDDAVISIDGMNAAAALGDTARRGGDQFLHLSKETERVLDAALADGRPVSWTLLRGDEPVTVALTPVPACRARWQILAGDSEHAGTDGETISISVGIAQLADQVGGDDALAVVAAHELGHILLGHRKHLMGLEAQVAAARGGKARVAQRTLSAAYRRAERDADLLSQWLLTNAGYESPPGLRFYDRLAKRHPLSYSARHGSWGDRIRAMRMEHDAVLAQPANADGHRAPPLLFGKGNQG